MLVYCETYWGTHGCELHKGHGGYCICCCECQDHLTREEDGCVGAFPYYGKDTKFYGADAKIAQEKFDAAMDNNRGTINS